MKFAKVRITDHRPGAGAKPALERGPVTRGGGMTGLDHLTESQRREAETHDKFVRGYSPDAVEAAWEDLNIRTAYDPKSPEHRWVMGRRAALARLAARMEKGGML